MTAPTVSPCYAHGPETNIVPVATCQAPTCGQPIPRGARVLLRTARGAFEDYCIGCLPTAGVT